MLASGEYIRDVGGVDLDPPVIVERLLDEVVRSCRQHMPWRAGALALVTELRERAVPCAMVTMSYDRLARTVTDQLPLGTFATVVTGDHLREGKPHPEAYLTAADRLGVDPALCVAIEDSPTGVASAEAAGCVVVAVPHTVPIEPGPFRTVIASLTELTLDTLESLVRGQTIRTA